MDSGGRATQEQVPRVKRGVGEVTYMEVGNEDIAWSKYLSPQKKPSSFNLIAAIAFNEGLEVQLLYPTFSK